MWRYRATAALFLAVSVLGLVGCNSRTNSRYDAVPEGTPIIDNPARTAVTTEYTLSAEPTYRVGGPAPTPEGELESSMGSLSAVPLSDGGLLVAEMTRIHFFDSTGTRRAILGRSGSGPGEFQNISAACRTHGDTVVVRDPNNARISIIDSRSATLVRAFSSKSDHMYVGSCFDDGTFLVEGTEFVPETRALNLTYRRVRLDGSVVGSLKTAHRDRTRIRQVGVPHVTASGARWFFADAYFSEIRTFDTLGGLVRVIRTNDPLREVSQEASDAAQGAEAAQGSTLPRQTERAKVRLPFFSTIMATPDGRFWLRDPVEPGLAWEVWTLFDSEGKAAARLRIKQPPLGEIFYAIGFTSDGVIVRRGDNNGDAFVEIYRLVPSPMR